MRERDRLILWPVYFDSTKTRSQGRRLPKRLAVPTPKLSDIKTSVEKIGFRCDAVIEVAYPRSPWRKTGYISVHKKGPKNNLIKRVSENLLNVRP